MIQIRQLQDGLKAKKKLPQPVLLLEVLSSLKGEEEKESVTMSQKGIILSLLAKLCLGEYELLKKVLYDFLGSVQAGNFGEKTKTTMKKKRDYGGRGTTTTTRRKKPVGPEIARNGINLDEMLERELSTPNNTQPRSQNSEHLPHQIDLTEIPLVQQRIELPNLSIQLPITPLKQIEEQEQGEEKKLDQFWALINQPSKVKTKARNKAQDATVKTRKKTRQTQFIPEQINTDISLGLTSQGQLLREIANILQSTKKKKANEKQNLFHHEIFERQKEEDIFIFGNKDRAIQFYRENYDHFSKKKLYSEHINSQRGGFSEGHEFSQYSPFQEVTFENTNEQVKRNLDQEIKAQGQAIFNIFVVKNQMNRDNKATFFYDLLCDPQRYSLHQDKVNLFGEIRIKLSKNA